ncbi:MAG: hypothetical protein LRY62_00200 [Alphaproteobacteria bacterium]|nr:hypothetical protein [Alphaproteobacteria bacterium]
MKKILKAWNAYKHDQRGMTLIDVSIALVVIALVVFPLVKEYERYMTDLKNDRINTTLATANAAIEKFYFRTGRYPCPADIEMMPGDPNYGLELFNADELNPDVGYCFDPVTGDALNDQMQFARGMIPFKTLSLPEEDAYDPWGGRLAYTVTANMASRFFSKDDYEAGDPASWPPDPSQPHLYVDGFYKPYVEAYQNDVLYEVGAYVVENGLSYVATADTMGNAPPNPAFWNLFTDAVLPATNDQVHYIIISHGPNNMGAYNKDGVEMVSCTSAGERESMNCDGDELFFDRGRKDLSGAFGFSEMAGAEFLDDYVFFRSSSPFINPRSSVSRLPGATMTWSPQDVNTGDVQTKYSNVGIGYDNPDDTLDVNGDIKVTSGDLMAAELCDQNDENCFFTHYITGSTNVDGEEVGYIWCEKGAGFASAIQGSDATCNPASVNYFGGFQGACPGGQVMTGIMGGSIQCIASPFTGP